MNHTLKRLASGILTVCLLTSAALAAQIAPSVSQVELKEHETTVSFDISLKTSAPFAGAEFGIKTSDPDVALQSLTYLEDIRHESTVKTVKDGVLYFGFFAGSNKYEAGTYQVARLTYTYAGTAPRTIALDSSKIVTLDEVTGQTVGDTSSDPFTVTITRVPSGGGDGGGGGGGAITPVEPSKPSGGGDDIWFVDVPKDAWFYEPVQYVAKNELFAGVGGDRFSPNTPMTRAMLGTVLYRLNQRMERPVEATQKVTFLDVPAGTWYADAALWSGGAEIIKGIGKDRFAPDMNVTREQIASILFRYAKASGQDPAASPQSIQTFRDAAEVSDFAVEAMGWAVAEGLIHGRDNNCLAPQAPASRAEVAAILMAYLDGRPV